MYVDQDTQGAQKEYCCYKINEYLKGNLVKHVLNCYNYKLDLIAFCHQVLSSIPLVLFTADLSFNQIDHPSYKLASLNTTVILTLTCVLFFYNLWTLLSYNSFYFLAVKTIIRKMFVRIVLYNFGLLLYLFIKRNK